MALRLRSATSSLLLLLACASLAHRVGAARADAAAATLRVAIPGRTVHNSTYRHAALLYALQVLVGGAPPARDVTTAGLVVRTGSDLVLDLARLTPDEAGLLKEIAAQDAPADVIGLDEIEAYLQPRYYALTKPAPTLEALRREQGFGDNPDWLTVPVDSATFERRRVLRVPRERIADALAAYFANGDRVLFPAGTVIVAESLDAGGAFIEAEVLRKRPDGFWNFAVYDRAGRLADHTVAPAEEGRPPGPGFRVPSDCALCHRVDRLDGSGDPEAPVRSPVRGFFHRLPAEVPQIHLGPEYHDHAAFTELTEATHRVKDGVFGPYASLLLSELAGRKRLGRLTPGDRARYLRLAPSFPELLSSPDRVDSVVNSMGMRLLRIPAAAPATRLGSNTADGEHRADEHLHAARVPRDFFLAEHEVTNAQFRRFRPAHHSPPFRGVDLDGDDQPVVGLDYASAAAFADWLGALSEERAAGRTYRLPTEDEWEFAARGGDGRRFPWGDQWPPPPGAGNFGGEETGRVFTTDWPFLHGYDDAFVGTAPVGRFPPNGYLLYDMAGNAYEWTSSLYEPFPGATQPAPDARRPYGAGLRVLRGSSWGDELPKVLRCAFRLPVAPDTRWPFAGLRVAADIPALR